MTTIETPKGQIELRRAIPSDGPALRALRVEALRLYPSAFSSDTQRIEAQSDESWSERIQTSNESNTTAIWIAASDGSIIGTATLFRETGPKIQHRGLLVAVYMNKTWRGLGIIEALIHELLAWAASIGIEIVELGVNTTNTRAIALYTRLGFNVYGLQRDYLRTDDGVKHDLLFMARNV